MDEKALALNARMPHTLGGTLGIEVLEATGQQVVARMPVGPAVHQPFGILHGGASVALAETVASIGAYLAAPEGHMAVGLEINANHLRPMVQGWVKATATPIHQGRTTQVWQIHLEDEGSGKAVCTSRCTLAVLPMPSEAPSA